MMVGKNRRILGLFLACTVVGWFGMLASPVFAHTPPDNNANFNPDEFNGDGIVGARTGAAATDRDLKEAEIIADAEDGFGTAYELRAVADSQTAFYEWYNCTPASNPSTPGSACQPIASDTTPDAAPTPPGEGTAAAFSGSYNVPSTSETDAIALGDALGPGGLRDIYGIACASDATAGGPPFDASHCIPNDVTTPAASNEVAPPAACALAGTATSNTCINDVHLDDSQTTAAMHPATTNGHIRALVTASKTFVGDEVHGAGLKNGDTVTAIAFTSNGVDAVQICMDQLSDDETANETAPDQAGGSGTRAGCTHSGTDIFPEPGGGARCNAAAPVAPSGDCWAVTVGVPNANTVFGVSLIEYNDFDNTEGMSFGTGDCSGATTSANGDDCQLDKIYLTTTTAGEGIAPTPPPPVTPTPLPPPRPNCPAGLDNIRGTKGNDKIKGSANCDKIRALKGNDLLRGRAGDDRLVGGGGNDRVIGGGGFDICSGNAGRDRFKGCEEIRKP